MIFWLAAVGIPYLALMALTVLDRSEDWQTFSRRVIELGVDACILGIGVSGAVFGAHEVRAKMGDSTAVVAVAAVLLELVITGLCFRLRRQPARLGEEWRARLSIFLGVAILALNTGVALRYQ